MIDIESLVARTRDNVEIEIGAPDHADCLIQVSGELDVHDLRTPHETLSLVLNVCGHEARVVYLPRGPPREEPFQRTKPWQERASVEHCGIPALAVY